MGKKIVIFFLCLASFFVALELSFRAYDILTSKILSDDLLANLYMMSGEGHPFLQYTGLKNFSGLLPQLEPGKKFKVQTNSDGFRTPEFYPKLPGQFRIILMGDSYMYGYNANQIETPGVQLEKILQDKVSKDIEILSLGIPSYSGISYAMLARIYFDYLKPDLVIVAVDQSDFKDDLNRAEKYIFDDNGLPLITKEAAESKDYDDNVSIAIDASGKQNVSNLKLGWLLKLRFGSSLFNHSYIFWKSINEYVGWYKGEMIIKKYQKSLKVIKYEDLVKEYGPNLEKILPGVILRDTIPYDLDTAIEKYPVTFKALEFIKNKCKENNVMLYLSSYPGPWFVSPNESAAFQLLHTGAVYDFRKNRVFPQLMDNFALQLKVKHLNAYPIFEVETLNKRYGNYDTHFNAYGYQLYADFLADSIKDDIIKIIKPK